jgi:hypothetical protein
MALVMLIVHDKKQAKKNDLLRHDGFNLVVT